VLAVANIVTLSFIQTNFELNFIIIFNVLVLNKIKNLR
jgi:hypothetical protein